MSTRLNLSDELQYIYSTLRRLKSLNRIASTGAILSADPRQENRVDIFDVASLFPRKFILKLLDERIGDLNDLADKVAVRLFKKFSTRGQAGIENNEATGGPQKAMANSTTPTAIQKALGNAKYPELDEYFHFSFNSLYDFFIEFDWHEAEIDILDKSDLGFVQKHLHHFNGYLEFQKSIDDFRKTLATPRTNSSAASMKGEKSLLKSNMSVADRMSSRSPGQRRRVRFKDSTPEDSGVAHLTSLDKILRDSQSIMALKLLIYSMNNLIQYLCNQLANWVESHGSEFSESIEKILESKRKVSSNQLQSLVLKIKTSNEIYLNFLSSVSEIKKRYLIDYTLGIICARDEENVLKQYKIPILSVYLARIAREVERQVIDRLSDQILQLLTDLIVNELSLPPVELDQRGRRSKSPQKAAERVGSRENQTNFLTTWLNMTDHLLFGKREPAIKVELEKGRPANTKLTNKSQHSTLGEFKSSSQILNQMDHLREMGRLLILGILIRLDNSQRQLRRYFVELIYVGVDLTFENLAPKLQDQLIGAKSAENEQQVDRSQERKSTETMGEQERDIVKSLNIMAAKVRCLKFIQIIGSLDELMKDIVRQEKFPIIERTLDVRVKQFTDFCAQKSGSSFK